MAFNRVAELIIGKAGTPGTSIKNLYMQFNILKTDKNSGNKAEIQVFNASETTVKKVAQIGNALVFRAGYEDEGGAKALFFGDITSSLFRREPPETILELVAFDGHKNSLEKNISVSYAEGSTVQSVVTDIISVLDYPLGNVVNWGVSQFVGGFAYIGKATGALTEALLQIDKKWMIQNEQIIIFDDIEGVTESGLSLSPTTGLLKTPRELNDLETSQKPNSVPKRYEIETLLFPELSPGAKITISSSTANGYFKVKTTNFLGDTWTGDFKAVSEVEAI